MGHCYRPVAGTDQRHARSSGRTWGPTLPAPPQAGAPALPPTDDANPKPGPGETLRTPATSDRHPLEARTGALLPDAAYAKENTVGTASCPPLAL